MKKVVAILLALSLCAVLVSCSAKSNTPVLDNSNNSTFVDFYTDGGYVYIECVLNIYNPSEKETKVNITAADDEDVEIGLLKSNILTGFDKSGNDVFVLESGENKITVLFKGEYAGIYQITAREIPRFITIEKA